MGKTMNLTLKVWRQKNALSKGRLETYVLQEIDADASFLEMLDILNTQLEKKGEEPVAFEHDCREGICGCCGGVVNGQTHGPVRETTLCQLHMRHFNDGDTIVIEPWRSRAFPLIKDLVVDRSARQLLAREGFDPQFGARPLKRAIQDLVLNPLATRLLRGEFKPGDRIKAVARDGAIEFEKQ